MDLAGQVECEDFFRDDASAVEGVVEPEVRCQGMVRGDCDDAVFEQVVRLQAEDADRFDTDVVVGRIVRYGGIRTVGDGARKYVRGAARGVRDAHERNFDRLEAAVEIEIQAGELSGAKFVVDADAGVDFLAGVAIRFKAVFGFKEFDLRGVLLGGSGLQILGGRFGLLRPNRRGRCNKYRKSEGNSRKERAKSGQEVLKKILGFGRAAVKKSFGEVSAP